MSEKAQAIGAMLKAYRQDGGSVDELVDAYGSDPGQVMFLAGQYGLDRDDMDQLVQLSERADDMLAEAERKTRAKERAKIPKRKRIKQMAKDLLAYKAELQEDIEAGDGDAELAEPNSKRFPGLFLTYTVKHGGDEGEFNTLSPSEILALGGDAERLAEDLAREMWADGPPESGAYDDLPGDQKAELKVAALAHLRRFGD